MPLNGIFKSQLVYVLILLLALASLTPPVSLIALSLTSWGSEMHGGGYLGLGTIQMEFKPLPLNNLCHLKQVHSTLGLRLLSKVEEMIPTLQKYYEDELV